MLCVLCYVPPPGVEFPGIVHQGSTTVPLYCKIIPIVMYCFLSFDKVLRADVFYRGSRGGSPGPNRKFGVSSVLPQGYIICSLINSNNNTFCDVSIRGSLKFPQTSGSTVRPRYTRRAGEGRCLATYLCFVSNAVNLC